MDQIIRLLLAACAVYRAAQLLPFDDGPAYVFRRMRARLDKAAEREGLAAGRATGPWHSLRDGLTCPYCLGVWLAAGAAWLALYPTPAGDLLLAWLGLAGAAAWLQGNR